MKNATQDRFHPFGFTLFSSTYDQFDAARPEEMDEEADEEEADAEDGTSVSVLAEAAVAR